MTLLDRPRTAPLVSLVPGATADLAAFDGFVRVEGGRVELYGRVGETRCFLAELPPGAILFGGGAGRLLALAPEGAELLPEAALPTATLIEALERWTAAIAFGLSRYAPARPALSTLQPGDTRRIESGEAVTAGRGVLWATLTGGSSRLFDAVEIEAPRLPLTPALWLVSSAARDIVASPTPQVVADGSWRPSLGALHLAAERMLDARIAADREEEARRVAEREGAVEADIVSANRRLVDILRTTDRPRAEHADDVNYVLDLVTAGYGAPLSRGASTLREALDRRGLRGRAVDLSGPWWRSDRGLLIGFLREDATPVALVPDWLGRYRLHRRGARPVTVTAAIAKDLGPRGVVVAQPLPDRVLTLADFGALGRSLCRAELVTIGIAMFGAAVTGLLLPLAIGTVIDTFIPDKLRSGVILLGLALVLLTLCSSLLRLVSDVARLRMDAKLSVVIQGGLIERVLRLPARFLRAQASADLTMRVMGIDQLRRLLTGAVTGPAISGVFALTNFVLLFYYSLPAATAALILFVGFLAVAIISGQAQLRALTTGEALSFNLSAFSLQIIQNVALLRAFGAERRAFSRWAHQAAIVRSRGLRARFASIGFETFVAAYDGLALATVFLILGASAGGDRLSTGDYLAFVAAYQGFLFSIQGLGRAIVQVQGVKPALTRTRELLAEVPETTTWAQDPGTLRGEIEVSNLSFAYEPGGPMVLQGVSIPIAPGKFIAFAGPSGCGKSTLLNLILGFHQPTSGAVLYDGRDLARLNKTAVRQQLGVVRQGGRLIGGSIFENIIGLYDGTVEDAWAAAEAAGIAEDIRALPMGMHTVLSEGLPTFSGGQVQRLLIARALVGRPKALLLDEATSALDNITQAAVSNGIERLGITRIVVAHRLSTIKNADRIYFFQGGRIAESGTYDQLMAQNGLFAAFASRQTLAPAPLRLASA